MKKNTIKKLASSTLIAMLFSLLIMPITFAEDVTAPTGTNPSPEVLSPVISSEAQKAIDGFRNKENCLQSTLNFDINTQTDYLITVLEEPLSYGQQGKPGDDYISVICFRQTLSIIDENKRENTAVAMTDSCKPESINSDDLIIKVYCEQVQVILSKAGTSLITGYIGTIYRWAASIVGVIAVSLIVVSGIQISASGGDQEAVTAAKKRILQSISGIIVLFLASLILFTINPGFFRTDERPSQPTSTTQTP